MGLLRCCGVAQLVGWVASRHSWGSEVTVLQLEVQRPRPSRTAPRFLGWRSEVGGHAFVECWGPTRLSIEAGRSLFL